MLAGPVFEFELLTTARRGRYYVVRVAYAVVLLLVLWQMYVGWQEEFGRVLTNRLVARFAHATFAALAVGQEVLVLVLVPAMTAGVIAAEKQSKTLHYVLASPLTGLEVVLGKLLARMLHVGIFLAVSLPIMSLLVLLGGVDPRLVVLGCAVPAAGAFFLASLAVLASTYARRVREALFLTYALELLWLGAPEVLRRFMPLGLPVISDLIGTANDWMIAASPVAAGWQLLATFLMGSNALVDDLIWMGALQAGAGLVLVALAAWRLRPVFRRQESSSRRSLADRLGARGAGWRLGARPACGDRPVAWKECHTSRSTRLARAVGGLVTLMIGVPLVYWTLYLGALAFDEMRFFGWDVPFTWRTMPQRWVFAGFLQVVLPLLFLLGLVGVAGSAAASITSEHEDDTWVSLTSTDLTGREVVLGKMAGSLRGMRRVGAVLGVLALFGLAVGSVHWIGVVAVGVAVAVFAWFAAALGVWVSLQLKSTWRAQFLTVAILLLVNVIGQTVFGALRPYSAAVWPGFMPVQLSRMLLDRAAAHELTLESPATRLSSFSVDMLTTGAFWPMVLGALSVVVYGGLAAALTWGAVRRFETVAGRPRRSEAPPQARPAATAPGLKNAA